MKNERLQELEIAASAVESTNAKLLAEKNQERNGRVRIQKETFNKKRSLQELSNRIKSAVSSEPENKPSKPVSIKHYFKDLYISNCYYNPVHWDVAVNCSNVVDVKLSESLTATLGLADPGSKYEQDYPINEELTLNVHTVIIIKSSKSDTPVETHLIGDEGILSISVDNSDGYTGYKGHLYDTGSSLFKENYKEVKEVVDEALKHLEESKQGSISAK